MSLTFLETLAEVLANRMTDPKYGSLRETFYRDWRYSPARTRDRVYVGHTLKAAWLLLLLHGMTGERRLENAARRMLTFGLRHAWDDRHFGFFDAVFRDGRRASGHKTWWTECDGLLALTRAYAVTGEPTYLARADQLIRFCLSSFVDAEYGEWFVSCHADGSVKDDRKGCEGKGAFHTVQATHFASEYLSRLPKS